ncbi:MAG: hypothetical protein JWM78_3020 [Verrucomicrobiaceae bacterium]|nr:hypothetical protein [Verrucomicrobiaceae bacterium]
MISTFKKHSGWIWLLCFALIAVRIGGAHLHLCFDGMEQPLAIHAGDIAEHDDHSDVPHSDTDLNLVDSGIAKTITQLFHLPALIAAIVLLCLQTVARGIPSATYNPPLFRFIPHRFSAPRAPPR